MTASSGTTLHRATYLIAIMAGMVAQPASAQLFSPRNGYAADGSYRVQVEVTPYLWLPAQRDAGPQPSARYGCQH
jgi:hypothetical protein